MRLDFGLWIWHFCEGCGDFYLPGSFGFIGLGFLLLSWILSVSGVCGAFVIVLILIAGFSSSYGLF